MSEQYIRNLISEKEHQQLDFKFQINDSKKIARTLVAFANTDGGRLLVGVKDNGRIAGVRSDEEYHMVEAAAQMYCKPPLPFQHAIHVINGKSILEVTIIGQDERLYRAPDEKGKWKVYIRCGDENFPANHVYLEVWKKKKHQINAFIAYGAGEDFLMAYLEKHPHISLSTFVRLAMIKKSEAEKILVGFMLAGIIDIVFSQQGIYYIPSNDTTHKKQD